MKIRKNATYSRATWLSRPIGANRLKPWLSEQGSLTLRLVKNFSDFQVRPIYQGLSKPNPDEASALALNMRQNVYLREVLLCGNQQTLVFAHSMTAAINLRGSWQALPRLGRHSLGTMLFSNPRISRTILQYKKLNQHHPLFKKIVQLTGRTQPVLWARRSQFSINRDKKTAMMVTEVFFPSLLEFKAKS